MDRKKPLPQEFYRHFEDKLYQIIAVAKHAETGEELVVYQALYGTYEIYAEPLSLFMSETDHKNDSGARQKYRFEKVFPGKEADMELQEKKVSVRNKSVKNTESINTLKKQEPAEFKDAGGDRPNPDLMEFLDADTLEKKRRILIGMRTRITDRLIDDLAASLDVTVEKGELDERYRDLLTCVETMERFEVNRLR